MRLKQWLFDRKIRRLRKHFETHSQIDAIRDAERDDRVVTNYNVHISGNPEYVQRALQRYKDSAANVTFGYR